jgi:hypothetical protein
LFYFLGFIPEPNAEILSQNGGRKQDNKDATNLFIYLFIFTLLSKGWRQASSQPM